MPHPNPDVETKTAGFLRKRVRGYISRDRRGLFFKHTFFKHVSLPVILNRQDVRHDDMWAESNQG